MKRALSILICTVLLLAVAVSPAQAAITTVKDVDVNDPSYDKVSWAMEQGYMKPVLGRFLPDKKVNRGEFAYILCKVSGNITNLKYPSKPTFSDITKNYQYYKYVETMKRYINSYKGSDGKKLFRPKDYITREDAAMAVVKLLGFDSDEALIDAVESDISIEDIVADYNKVSKANVKYVEIVTTNELMDFRTDDEGNVYFDPKATIKRKDLASLLWNATQQRDYLKEQYEDNEDAVVNSDDEINSEDEDYTYDDSTNENSNNSYNNKETNIGNDKEYPWNRDININFVSNPDYLGSWESVAFVNSMDAFTPGMTQGFDLYLRNLTLYEKGSTNWPGLKWSDGRILYIGDNANANLILKEIDGEDYLFLQWISGDQLFRGMQPSWYVLKRVK